MWRVIFDPKLQPTRYKTRWLLDCISLVCNTHPQRLEAQARKQGSEDDEDNGDDDSGWMKKLGRTHTWKKIGQTYVMEWQMVWQDVLIGFTVAGVMAFIFSDLVVLPVLRINARAGLLGLL